VDGRGAESGWITEQVRSSIQRDDGSRVYRTAGSRRKRLVQGSDSGIAL
ncbi:uncharacterized protein METZ01_LOCUS373377, partial [marine metagenome]